MVRNRDTSCFTRKPGPLLVRPTKNRSKNWKHVLFDDNLLAGRRIVAGIHARSGSCGQRYPSCRRHFARGFADRPWGHRDQWRLNTDRGADGPKCVGV